MIRTYVNFHCKCTRSLKVQMRLRTHTPRSTFYPSFLPLTYFSVPLSCILWFLTAPLCFPLPPPLLLPLPPPLPMIQVMARFEEELSRIQKEKRLGSPTGGARRGDGGGHGGEGRHGVEDVLQSAPVGGDTWGTKLRVGAGGVGAGGGRDRGGGGRGLQEEVHAQMQHTRMAEVRIAELESKYLWVFGYTWNMFKIYHKHHCKLFLTKMPVQTYSIRGTGSITSTTRRCTTWRRIRRQWRSGRG